MARKKTSSKGDSTGFFKKILFVVMFLAIVSLSGFIYLMLNFDSYKAQIAEKITMKLDKVSLDPAKLTEKQTKLRLHILVNNGLPVVVIFKNLNFDLNLGDYQVAKGMQAEAMTALKANADTNVVVALNVDSIQARRAIQKGIERNVGTIVKAVLSQKSVQKAVGEDIKAITQIKGSVDLMFKIGSFEMPFTKTVKF